MALTVEDLYRQYAGREADPGGLEFWRAGFGSEISPQEVASFQQAVSEARAQGTEPAPVAQAAAKPSLVDQILASSDTSKWSGEGKGSVRANAEDMANILSGIGITDISQFGQIEVPLDVSVRPIYEYIPEGYGDSASYTARIAGYTDQNGNPVDPSLVKTSTILGSSGDGAGYETIYTAPLGTQTTYGNKVTGQVVPNTYGERQTGDAFGGTYSGKGNTGYRAQFTPDGKPVFYTSAQSSSSLPELMPFIQLGLAATGAGGLLGGALNSGLGLGLGTAGTSALGGAALGGLTSAATGQDVLKGAALGGLGGYAGNALGDYLKAGAGNMSIEEWANATGNYNPSLNLSAEDWAQINGNYQVGGDSNPVYDYREIPTGNTPGYYDEITGKFVEDPLGGLQGPLDNTSGTNISSMDGYSYDPTTQTWTMPDGSQVTSITGVTNGAVTGADLLSNAGATTTSFPAITPGKVIDALKLGTAVAAIGGSATGNGQTGFDIVPVPSDWKTPTYGQPGQIGQIGQPGQYQGLSPIDFGSRELLRGTQWEKYLNPAQPTVVPAPQTGMNYNQLMSALQGGQGGSLSLNDIISGIQGQYGQTPSGTVG